MPEFDDTEDVAIAHVKYKCTESRDGESNFSLNYVRWLLNSFHPDSAFGGSPISAPLGRFVYRVQLQGVFQPNDQVRLCTPAITTAVVIK